MSFGKTITHLQTIDDIEHLEAHPYHLELLSLAEELPAEYLFRAWQLAATRESWRVFRVTLEPFSLPEGQHVEQLSALTSLVNIED